MQARPNFTDFFYGGVVREKIRKVWPDIDFSLNYIQWNRIDIDFPTSRFETGTANFGPYSPETNEGISRLGTEDKCQARHDLSNKCKAKVQPATERLMTRLGPSVVIEKWPEPGPCRPLRWTGRQKNVLFGICDP